MKRLFVTLVFLSFQLEACASDIFRSEFEFSISPSSIKCFEGNPSGEYPVPTLMTIATGPGSTSLTGFNRPVYLNVNQVILNSDKACAELISEASSGRGVQVISETEVKTAGQCLRQTHEKLVLKIGTLNFSGENDFFVGPRSCPR